MSDASSFRRSTKRTSLPAANKNKGAVRFYDPYNRPVVSNGEAWKDIVDTKTFQVTSKDVVTAAFYVATETVRVVSVSETHSTAESTGTTITLQVTKETGTQAAGAGVNILTTGIPATTTADTSQSGTLVSTDPDVVILYAGDRLSIKPSAAVTELAGLTLTVTLEKQSNTVDVVKVVTTAAAIATQNIFVAPSPCRVVAVKEWHAVAGTNGSAVTVDITKETATGAGATAVPGGGSTILTAALSLKATAKTTQSGTLSATATSLVLGKGDRLSIKLTGTATAVAGVVIAVAIQPIDPSVTYVTLNQNANSAVATTAMFVASAPCVVTGMAESHATLGTNGGAVTLTVTKDATTAAPGAGTTLLSDSAGAGVDLKGTVNTPQYGTLTTTYPLLVLAKGDKVSSKPAGTLTAVAGMVTTLELQNF